MKKYIFLFGCLMLLCGAVFSQGYWTAKANVINGSRCNATSFSIGNKGYICCGVTTVQKKDLLEYDPLTDTWTQKADFPGLARRCPVSFVVGARLMWALAQQELPIRIIMTFMNMIRQPIPGLQRPASRAPGELMPITLPCRGRDMLVAEQTEQI